MLDFSWSELALIGVVALVVIGPKDLPRALRTAGNWARKARTISREFQSSIEQMVRDAELDEVKKEVEAATSLNVEEEFKKVVDPSGSLAESLKAPELPELGEVTGEAAPKPQDAAAPAALPPPEEAFSIAPPSLLKPEEAPAVPAASEAPAAVDEHHPAAPHHGNAA